MFANLKEILVGRREAGNRLKEMSASLREMFPSRREARDLLKERAAGLRERPSILREQRDLGPGKRPRGELTRKNLLARAGFFPA